MKYEYSDMRIFNGTYSCSTTQAVFPGARRFNQAKDPTTGTLTWNLPAVPETDEQLEKRLWQALCAILTKSESIPVLLYTTDKEPEWRDMVAGCGYAKMALETKTQHVPRDYNVQLWIFPEHEPDRAS